MTALNITEAATVQMPMVRHAAEVGWARPELPALPPAGGCGLGRPLPHPADAVLVKEGFVGYENEVMRQRLGDEHPVEGVVMDAGQRPGAGGVGYGYWQFLEILPGDCSGNVQRQHFRFRQSSEPVLGGDFPRRCRAD